MSNSTPSNVMINPQEIKNLVAKARLSRERAFVLRSNHPIGAAVLTRSNNIFDGCNIESIIMGLGSCAEQNAINHAIIHGEHEFKALLTIDETKTYPCGVCLQYLYQFFQIDEQDIEIIAADLSGAYEVASLTSLLPHAYKTRQHLDRLRSFRHSF
ncbi:TPA: cytidine deaminase [Candidatus Dependentiae bacterium]|nr:cytidine deaminase [Candidatus Dependentiae bacterium]